MYKSIRNFFVKGGNKCDDFCTVTLFSLPVSFQCNLALESIESGGKLINRCTVSCAFNLQYVYVYAYIYIYVCN